MTAAKSVTAGRERFVSLDVFRGLAICLMILVNTPGPAAPPYPALVHARWIGFTLADVVFPSFLFAVGTAMSFALSTGSPTGAFLRGVGRRAGLIFLLGVLMYWYPFVAQGDDGWMWKPFAQTRIPGVLQRIALCYAAAAIACRWVGERRLIGLAIALILVHWLILLAFSPIGMAFDKAANIGTWLDGQLIGPAHLYRRDHGFDPEGLLGTIPATANVIAGFLTGRFVQRHGRTRSTVTGTALAGLCLIAGGCALAPWLPIAKKLWTGSFVLLTIGIDLIVLAAIIQLVERMGTRIGVRFLAIPGRNPLAIYLFSELFIATLSLVDIAGETPYAWLGMAVAFLAPGAFGSFICAAIYTLCCWMVSWWLDRRGLILKV